MKSILSSSVLVVALLCLDAVSVSARRNGTQSLARKRSGKAKRACTTKTTTSEFPRYGTKLGRSVLRRCSAGADIDRCADPVN